MPICEGRARPPYRYPTIAGSPRRCRQNSRREVKLGGSAPTGLLIAAEWRHPSAPRPCHCSLVHLTLRGIVTRTGIRIEHAVESNRSEAGRVGKECVSTGRSWVSPVHEKKKKK